MIVLNEERLTWVLREISKGFSLSPLEVVAFFIITTSLLVFFIWYYKKDVKKSILREKRLSEEITKKYIKKLKLTPREIRLIRLMSKYMDSPYRFYLLFENQYIFNRCAFKILKEYPANEQIISSLRVKLNFKHDKPYFIPRSTAELKENDSIYIRYGEKLIPAFVEELSPDYLNIFIDSQDYVPTKGKTIELEYFNPSGLYKFKTKVKKALKNHILLSHTENIQKIQRRKFFRKKMNIPSAIKLENSNNLFFTTITDISGGGVRLKKPNTIIKPGDTVTVEFRLKGYKETFKINSKVKSETDNSLHLYFLDINNTNREKIIKFIFKK